MALAHVKAGANMVAPSDMMDGRISAIRKVLDDNGFINTPIMSYSVKYASSFYGPFREAADSAPGKGDRKGYQMDFANSRDASIELESDYEEGADILMVKPGLPYLDILKFASENYNCPIATYQVSGEYSMIKAATEKGWIDEKKIVLVITHTPDRVIDLFDDVIVLAKDAKRVGRLAWYGPVKEAYEFFGKNSMEEILLTINQKDEGGEGRADEFIEKFAERMKEKVG